MSLTDFTGTDNLEDALKMWHAEREAMCELHDENTALKIYNRRLRLVIDLVLRLCAELDKGGMFLPQKVPSLVTTIRKVIKDMEVSIIGSKEL